MRMAPAIVLHRPCARPNLARTCPCRPRTEMDIRAKSPTAPWSSRAIRQARPWLAASTRAPHMAAAAAQHHHIILRHRPCLCLVPAPVRSTETTHSRDHLQARDRHRHNSRTRATLHTRHTTISQLSYRVPRRRRLCKIKASTDRRGSSSSSSNNLRLLLIPGTSHRAHGVTDGRASRSRAAIARFEPPKYCWSFAFEHSCVLACTYTCSLHLYVYIYHVLVSVRRCGLFSWLWLWRVSRRGLCIRMLRIHDCITLNPVLFGLKVDAQCRNAYCGLAVVLCRALDLTCSPVIGHVTIN